jgi:hypothetical protein
MHSSCENQLQEQFVSYEFHPIYGFLHGNSCQGPSFIVIKLKNNSSIPISQLYSTTASAFGQAGPCFHILKQNIQIPLQDVHLVRRRVRGINPLNEMDLLKFGQSGATGQRPDKLSKSRHDPERLSFLTSPLLEIVIDLIH